MAMQAGRANAMARRVAPKAPKAGRDHRRRNGNGNGNGIGEATASPLIPPLIPPLIQACAGNFCDVRLAKERVALTGGLPRPSFASVR
jgi:hypothetical protein